MGVGGGLRGDSHFIDAYHSISSVIRLSLFSFRNNPNKSKSIS